MREIKFTRINSNFEPRITVDKLEKKDVQYKEKSDGIYRLTAYEDEDGNKYYSFGFMCNEANQRPGHGGKWSSNSNNINKEFDIDITECAIKERHGKYQSYFAMAIAKKDIPIPDCLEWRDDWGFNSIMLKSGIEFPRSKGYWMHTILDADGNLLEPKPVSA